MNALRRTSTLVLCAVALPVWSADNQDVLKDYLANIDPGAVSAAEILGMSGSAVGSIQTTKDLVAAISNATGEQGQAGFAVSFSPARSSIDGLSMSMENYLEERNVLGRLWGNTTFSYAQNRNTVGGIDYRQQAIAMRVVYFFDRKADPVVASHDAFKNPDCRQDLAGPLILAEVTAESQRLGRTLTNDERQALRLRLKTQAPIKASLVKDADKQAECISTAVKDAGVRWNSSQLAVTLGQGWIRSPAASASRLSLSRQLSVTGAWAPNKEGLINLTVRHIDKELDLDTIAADPPAHSSATLAAVRYTLGFGDDKDFYALAEVSNVSKKRNTVADGAFKYALGVDKKFGENMWLEFRLGRNRTATDNGSQTVALLNLKISPSSGVASLGR